jgi:hypothetical protein
MNHISTTHKKLLLTGLLVLAALLEEALVVAAARLDEEEFLALVDGDEALVELRALTGWLPLILLTAAAAAAGGFALLGAAVAMRLPHLIHAAWLGTSACHTHFLAICLLSLCVV